MSQGLAYTEVANIIKMSGLKMTKALPQISWGLCSDIPTYIVIFFVLRAQLTVNQYTCLMERRQSSKAQMSLRHLLISSAKAVEPHGQRSGYVEL